jgi:DNA-binding MarR family transcriptional regulator
VSGGLNSQFDDAAQSPGLALWRVTNAWQRAIRAALAPHGLTHVQFVLLASLVHMAASDAVTQRQLATAASTDVKMTSQVLRALEARGLVERHPHPSDGRARALLPTPPGVSLANHTVAVVEAADRAFFAPLGDDVAKLASALGILADAG